MEAASLFIPQISRGIMDEEDELGTPSSSFSGDSANSNDSSSSELTEDATSPGSTSSLSPSPPPPSKEPYEMSSLMAQLPFKRGLSRHFHGKSQSFTSLSNVRCLEDLAKPERPYKKKLKPSKSYGAGLDSHKPPYSPCGCSKAISKRPSRGALPSLLVKRHGFLGGGAGRPPVPPHRSSGFSTQTLLFA